MNGLSFVRAPDGLRGVATRELSSPRYHLATPAPATRPWWESLTAWLANLWQYVWQAVFGHAHAGNAPAVAGDVLMVVAVLAVLVIGLRLLSTALIDRRRTIAAEPIAERISAGEWYRKAVVRAARGDLTGASRCVLAAAVAALSERGAIDPGAGATLGDLRRELDVRAPQYAQSFSIVARVFAIGAYAERPLDPTEFEGAIGAYLTIARDA